MWWRGGREGSAPSGPWYGSHQPFDEALRAIMRGAREGGGEREIKCICESVICLKLLFSNTKLSLWYSYGNALFSDRTHIEIETGW